MDTVIIKTRRFKILRPDRFTPEYKTRTYSRLSESEQFSDKNYLQSFLLTSGPHDDYLPRVVIYESLPSVAKKIVYEMAIIFSVPKLVHGIGLEEVSPENLQRTCELLQSRLREVGIAVSADTIKTARVHSVHFCKNVILPRDIRMQEILGDLAKLDVNATVDITSKEFKNGGNVLTIHSGVRQYSFYEKIADIRRPKNKRFDKSDEGKEREILERLNLGKRQVFRFEYRLNRQATADKELREILKFDSDRPILFLNLFTPGLWRIVILRSWRKLIGRQVNRLALNSEKDQIRILSSVLTTFKEMGEQPAHSLNKALATYGLIRLVQDHGAKTTTNSIREVWSDKHSERFTARIEEAVRMLENIEPSRALQFIDSELDRFEQITYQTIRKEVEYKS